MLHNKLRVHLFGKKLSLVGSLTLPAPMHALLSILNKVPAKQARIGLPAFMCALTLVGKSNSQCDYLKNS